MLYRRLRSVISHRRLCRLLFFACCVMSAICRASGARREMYICGYLVTWPKGHDARFYFLWREFKPRGVYVCHFFSSLFFQVFFMYYVQVRKSRHHRQHRRHASNARRVLEPAGSKSIYVCRLSAEKEATPHSCGSLSALYYCCGFILNSWLPLLLDPAIRRAVDLCCCVIHAFCHRYYGTGTS